MNPDQKQNQLIVADVLDCAANLIGTPDKWLKAAEAMTEDGTKVGALDRRAVRFCATGALDNVISYWPAPLTPTDTPTIQIQQMAEQYLRDAFGLDPEDDTDVQTANDDPKNGHAEIMAAFAEAAREARADAAWEG